MSNQVYASKGHRYLDPELKEIEINTTNIATNTSNILINSSKIVGLENYYESEIVPKQFECLDSNNRTPSLNLVFERNNKTVTLFIPGNVQTLVNGAGGGGSVLDTRFLLTTLIPAKYRPSGLAENYITRILVTPKDIAKVNITSLGQIYIYNSFDESLKWGAVAATDQGWKDITITYIIP